MATVLIVEDDYFLAAELEWALTEAGHTVVGKAPSFDDVVKIVAATTPEIALVDNWLKGEKHGVDAARHLRTLGTIVIYVTAEADHVRLVDGQAADIVSKPYDMTDLLRAVARVVKSADAERPD